MKQPESLLLTAAHTTIEQVCALTQLGESTVRKYRTLLGARQVGRTVRYARAAVEAWQGPSVEAPTPIADERQRRKGARTFGLTGRGAVTGIDWTQRAREGR